MKAGTILMIGILAQVLASGIVMTTDADDTDAAVQTWSSGSCTCTLDTDTGVFTVSGTGQMQDYAGTNAPWASVSQSITSLVVQPGVTRIGAGSFNYCTSLASVTIPDSVTSIGGGAFEGCTFLASVTIPDSVTSIEYNAFYGCSTLASITIPSTVTSIGGYAFQRCTSLTSISFTSTTWNIISIGGQQFSLGTSTTPVTATVYSPNNVADGQLAGKTGSYTTINYVRDPNYFVITITVNDPTYGTVSVNSLTVPYGTPIGIDTQTGLFTVGTTAVTATPAAATAQYTYEFRSWSWVPNLDAVTEDITATATFDRYTNHYTVTVAVNDSNYGSVNVSSFTVSYGTAITAASNVLTVGSSTSTATPTASTAQYTYAFDSWSGVPAGGTITSDVTITANFTATVNQYTVTVNVNEPTYGTVSQASVTVDYGTSISASGNVLTIGSNTVTQTPATATAQYTYSFDSWTGTTATVTGDMAVTANFSRAVNQYTITITVNNSEYGSVSTSSVTVDYGTQISAALNVLSIGSTDVTATPTQATAQYTYAFVNWTDIPSGGKITDDTVITANFSRTVNQYTVTIVSNDANYGTVDVGSVTVDYGTSVSASSNVLSVGSTDSTATPTTSTAQYTYAFDSWSGVPQSGDVQADVTITAVFTRTTNQYTVTISVNDAEYGSVSSASMTVDYGTSVSTLNNVLTIGSTDVTATPQTSTAQYTYAFGSWTGAPQTVTEDVTITAVFTAAVNQYTITIVSSNTDYGTVDVSSVTVDYGTAIGTEGDLLIIATTVPTSVQATANQPTAQYTFSFLGWLDVPQTVTGNVTVTANFDAAVNQYTITIEVNDGAYGSVDVSSVTVDYGTSVSVSGNVLTIGSTDVTATPTPATAQYTYAFGSWADAPQIVTGDATVTATFTRTVNQYTITVIVSPSGYGSVDVASVTVDYGTPISLAQNVMTVGSTAVTATPTPATAQYTYSFDAWSGVPGSVTGDANVTAGFSRTINVYTITYNGNGGTPASVTETYEYGASADLTKRVIKSGYDFLGWNTESTATEPLSSYTVTGDAVLFAVFEDHVPVVIDAEEFIGALTHTESQRNMYGNILILIPLMIAIAMIVGLLSYVGLIQTRKN